MVVERDIYRSILDALDNAVVVLGEDLRLRYLNESATRYFSRAGSTGRKWEFLETFHPQDRDAVETFLETLREGGGPSEVRVRAQDAEGSLRHVMIHGKPYPGAEGSSILLEMCDVTEDERVRMELERRQVELREFREVMEAANFGVAIADPEGFLHYVNPYFAGVHGYRPQDLAGKNLLVFHNESQREEVKAINERLLAEGSYDSLEVWHMRRDGSVFPMLMNAVVIRDEEGKPAYMAATGLDISEQKLRENELSQYRERLEELVSERTLELASANERLHYEVEERARVEEELRLRNQELEAFAHSVSHDLRGSLTVIEGFARTALLAIEREDREEERECLERIAESAVRMQGFIESLLEYARMGRPGEGYAVADMDATLKKVLMDLDDSIRSCGARVVSMGPLPLVASEEARLYQVLKNLLENALKFTAGAAPPRVDIECSCCEGKAVVCVRDNGVGMQKEFHEKIFNPFFRCGTQPSAGLGIGLSIVKRVVEGWGGRVWVESRPGQGAAFYFTVPLHSG